MAEYVDIPEEPEDTPATDKSEDAGQPVTQVLIFTDELGFVIGVQPVGLPVVAVPEVLRQAKDLVDKHVAEVAAARLTS